MSSQGNSLVSGSKWSVLLAAISIATQLISVLVLSRIFLPVQFGYLAITLMVLEFAKTFNFMFLSKAIVLEKDLDNKFLGTASAIAILHTLASVVLLYFAWPVIRGFFNNSGFSEYSFGFILLMLALNAMYRPLRSVMEKNLRFKEIQKADIVIVVSTSAMQVVLALIFREEWVLYTGLLMLEAGRFLYFLTKSTYTLAWSTSSAGKIYQHAFSIVTSDLANKFAVQGDNLVISRYLDASSLGLYSRAYKLMKIPTMLLANIFNQMAFPAFAKRTADQTVSAYHKINYFLAFLTFPVIAVSLVFHQDIILLLLGPQWADVALPFCILSIGIYLRILYKVPISILQANAKFSWLMYSQILYAMCVILFAFSLKSYGIAGVALGTLAALFVNTIVLTTLSSKILSIRARDHIIVLARPFVQFCCLLGYTYFLLHFFSEMQWSSMYALFTAVASISLLYGVSILLRNKFVLGTLGIWWCDKLGKNK